MGEKRQILTRKYQLIPVGDKEEVNRVYQYIREGMKNQNLAMNQYLSALYVSAVEEISKDDRQELNRLYSRISNSKKGSAYSKDIQFPVGLPTTSSLSMKCKQDFSNQMKKGLMFGRVSLATYKADNPLLVHVDYVRLRSTNPHTDNGLYHEYSSHMEFVEKIMDGNPDIFIKFSNGITFKVVFGNPHKSHEQRLIFRNIFEEQFDVNGSSIQFDKTGRKIILNMAISMPVEEDGKLDEGTVVGVDLGVAVPAYCALNNDKYERLGIGSAEDLFRVRTKIQAQKRRVRKSLVSSRGGHGRKRKLQCEERNTRYERNYVQTYNHMVSKRIVDFAVKNKAKYINMEDLSGYNANDIILRNWSFYQMQQYIEYKAKMHGIEVRKINPAYTSQTCSCCGYVDKENRKTQSKFKCQNCGFEANADFNAARNIALSTDFVEKQKKKKTK